MKDSQWSGLIVIDKMPGPTSHDVVQQVRRKYRCRAGHAGTLDPFASGLLVVLLGQATRLARFFQATDKIYRATIKLGETTETYDVEGSVKVKSPVPYLSKNKIEASIEDFTGVIQQVPPMFSAVRVNGERLYRMARRGETVPREPRTIEIYSVQLIEKSGEFLKLEIHCSAGTYIRALAHDLGQALKCGAHLQELRRIWSGSLKVSDAVKLKDLTLPPGPGFISFNMLLPQLPRIDLDAEKSKKILHGNPVTVTVDKGDCRLFREDRLIAIAAVDEGLARPSLVFEKFE
jgi:tRNA pseudouridine55 synthase